MNISFSSKVAATDVTFFYLQNLHMNGSVQLNDILKVIVFLMELEDLGIIWQHFSTECALPFPLVCLRGSVSSILKGHGESQSLKINSMININYVYHQLDNIMI